MRRGAWLADLAGGASATVISVGGVRGAPRRGARAARAGHAPLRRLASSLALGIYGALAWSRFLAPFDPWPLLAVVAAAAASGLAIAFAVRLPPLWRAAARTLAGLGLVVAVLGLSGVPLALLAPQHWDELATGIGDGLASMVDVYAPCASCGPWVRVDILVGGAALLALGGVAGVALGSGIVRRMVALAPLLVAVGVPATSAPASRPLLEGAVIGALVLWFLCSGRVARHDARAAGALAAGALAVAIAVAPVAAGAGPLLDPAWLATSSGSGDSLAFDWRQSYGPLDWPRRGRVVLTIRARFPTYWKADTLASFDGSGWARGPGVAREPGGINGVPDPDEPRWRETIEVHVGDLVSPQVIGAGTTLNVDQAPRRVIRSPSGTWLMRDGLRKGDSYTADVYVPRPDPHTLSTLPPVYPQQLARYRDLRLPLGPGSGDVTVRYPPFQSRSPPVLARPGRRDFVPVRDAAFARSPYRPVLALARRLSQASTGPYDFTQRVEHYLQKGFVYDENVPDHRYPLVDFLLYDHRGYCQHFAGAMALLLRMGGIPARVAVGFASGQRKGDSHTWKVIDSDAHAWVEAWFPRYGWITFDPTPSAAPARRSQPLPTNPLGGSSQQGADPSDPSGQSKPKPEPDKPEPERAPHAAPGGSSAGPIALGAAIAAALAAVAAALVVLRRRRESDPEQRMRALRRALRRAGSPLKPATTLATLERRFARSPDAAQYVRALREARYGGRDPGPPTAAQRRALRRELAYGPFGSLRAWWALPPV